MGKGGFDSLFDKLKKQQDKSNVRDYDLSVKAALLKAIRFDKQNDVADDPNRFKAVICGRRSGKTTGVLTIALERCLMKANSQWVICGLTRPSIKRVYWRTVKKLNEDLDLQLSFNETDLTVEFPNHSVIFFAGAENASEIEKLRGNAFDGVIIDECKSFNLLVFSELIEDVIRPALADRQGTLIIIGTPGRELTGTFYEATQWPAQATKGPDGKLYPKNVRFKSPGWSEDVGVWSSHHWSAKENQGNPGIWKEFLKFKANNGWADNHPVWRREYLGLWVVDTSHLVFRFNPESNTWDLTELPAGHEWNFVLGLDPGYDDSFAFVVLAYSRTHPNLYEMASHKLPKINITTAAKFIKALEAEWGWFEVMTGDRAGLGKAIFAELAEIHDIYIERAEKGEKEDFVELINDDLDQLRFFVKKHSPLAEEMVMHKWVIKGGKRKDSDDTENDACDALIYAFRWCDHKRYKAAKNPVGKFTDEYWAEYEAEMVRKADASVKKRDPFNVDCLDEDNYV